MLGVLWSLAVAVAVMVAGDGVSAQGARAHLQHVSVADVNGTGTRHVCFSRQEANLYVLVAEAIDREEVAVGSILDVDGLEEAVGRIRDGRVVNEDGTITYEGQPPSQEELLATLTRAVFVEAHDSIGWGWISVNVSGAGCHEVSASNARVRLYSLTVAPQ